MEGVYLDILFSRWDQLVCSGVMVGGRRSVKLVIATGQKLIGHDSTTSKEKRCCYIMGVPERLEPVFLVSRRCDGDWARKCGRIRTVAGGEF